MKLPCLCLARTENFGSSLPVHIAQESTRQMMVSMSAADLMIVACAKVNWSQLSPIDRNFPGKVLLMCSVLVTAATPSICSTFEQSKSSLATSIQPEEKFNNEPVY